MRVALATLCEEVRARPDGRLDILGAAPDEVVVPGFPWEGRLRLALVLELRDDDDLGAAGMNVSVVRSSDGEVVGAVDPESAQQQRQLPERITGPVHMHFELQLRVRFTEAGVHRVLISTGGGEVMGDTAVNVRPRDQ